MSKLFLFALIWMACSGRRQHELMVVRNVAAGSFREYIISDPEISQPPLFTFSLKLGEQRSVKIERCRRALSEDKLFEAMLRGRGYIVEGASPKFPEGWGFFGFRFRGESMYGDLFSDQVDGVRGAMASTERCRTYLIRLQRPVEMRMPMRWGTPFAMPDGNCPLGSADLIWQMMIPFVVNAQFPFPVGTYCERPEEK
jgi:hypothetical protein